MQRHGKPSRGSGPTKKKSETSVREAADMERKSTRREPEAEDRHKSGREAPPEYGEGVTQNE